VCRIAKHSLFSIPFFGWTLAGWGHYSINRSNVESAKRSLRQAAASIHRYQRCLAVSPEGTRSKTGRLMDFKKGPFHTAIEVDLPIIPVLIMGAYQLWPPNQLFPVGGQVVVRMLPPIRRRAEEGYKELSGRVRRAMLNGIAEPVKGATVYTNSVLYVLWLPVTLTLLWWTVGVLRHAVGV
jgi:1-acyl-sn-glycerol-3-phosphate acyltransferase